MEHILAKVHQNQFSILEVLKINSGNEISEERIKYVLSYVKEKEQRVLSCKIKDKSITSLLRCETPDYTLNPLDYLSSSELMISTAQVGHILIDNYIRDKGFLYSNIITFEKLRELRDKHQIYFVSMEFQFHKKVSSVNYELKMDLENFKYINQNFVAKLKFNVGNSVKGSFIALVPKT